jgi:hypothetical protein
MEASMRNLNCGIVFISSVMLGGCLMQPTDYGTAAASQAPRNNNNNNGNAATADGGAGTGAGGGATQPPGAPGMATMDMAMAKIHYRDAEVDLDPVGMGTVNGEVLFLGANGALTMTLLAGGFTPGAAYTVEIHQNGNCRNDAKNIGPIWASTPAALANLGAPTVDAQGVGTLVKTAAWSVGDKNAATDIMDRSLVVMDAKGVPVACGVIWR